MHAVSSWFLARIRYLLDSWRAHLISSVAQLLMCTHNCFCVRVQSLSQNFGYQHFFACPLLVLVPKTCHLQAGVGVAGANSNPSLKDEYPINVDWCHFNSSSLQHYQATKKQSDTIVCQFFTIYTQALWENCADRPLPTSNPSSAVEGLPQGSYRATTFVQMHCSTIYPQKKRAIQIETDYIPRNKFSPGNLRNEFGSSEAASQTIRFIMTWIGCSHKPKSNRKFCCSVHNTLCLHFQNHILYETLTYYK